MFLVYSFGTRVESRILPPEVSPDKPRVGVGGVVGSVSHAVFTTATISRFWRCAMHAFLRPSVSVDSSSTRVFSTNQMMQCGSLVQNRDQAGRHSTGRQFLAALLVFSLCILLSGVMVAQSDLGGISGFVKDPSGAIIPNARSP